MIRNAFISLTRTRSATDFPRATYRRIEFRNSKRCLDFARHDKQWRGDLCVPLFAGRDGARPSKKLELRWCAAECAGEGRGLGADHDLAWRFLGWHFLARSWRHAWRRIDQLAV